MSRNRASTSTKAFIRGKAPSTTWPGMRSPNRSKYSFGMKWLKISIFIPAPLSVPPQCRPRPPRRFGKGKYSARGTFRLFAFFDLGGRGAAALAASPELCDASKEPFSASVEPPFRAFCAENLLFRPVARRPAVLLARSSRALPRLGLRLRAFGAAVRARRCRRHPAHGRPRAHQSDDRPCLGRA